MRALQWADATLSYYFDLIWVTPLSCTSCSAEVPIFASLFIPDVIPAPALLLLTSSSRSSMTSGFSKQRGFSLFVCFELKSITIRSMGRPRKAPSSFLFQRIAFCRGRSSDWTRLKSEGSVRLERTTTEMLPETQNCVEDASGLMFYGLNWNHCRNSFFPFSVFRVIRSCDM